MENTQTAINTLFGTLMVTFYLAYADCEVMVDGDEYVSLDVARDIAFEISAETNRRVNVYQCWGQSEHLVESVLA